MHRTFLPVLRIIVLSVAVITLSTGCTFFSRSEITDSQDDDSDQMVVEKTRSATIKIVDQNAEETTLPITFVEGENVYEILNRLIFSSEGLLMEFDSFQVNNQEEIMVVSINGYNPTEDGLTWVLKVNGQISRNGLLETRPNEGDTLQLELEKYQP